MSRIITVVYTGVETPVLKVAPDLRTEDFLYCLPHT